MTRQENDPTTPTQSGETARLTNDEKETARLWLYAHNGDQGGGLGGLWAMVEQIVQDRISLATRVVEYGVRDFSGTVIHDPSWRCEADVIHAMHGLGYKVPRGVLLTRTRTRYADELTPWDEVHRG